MVDWQRLFWAGVSVLAVSSRTATAQSQVGEVDPPACVIFADAGVVQDCTNDGSTRATASILEGNESVQFYAEGQEYWFTYTVDQDSNVIWQMYSIGGGPYMETTVFPNNVNAPALAYWRHSDRDETSGDTIDRFDLGSVSGGTTLDIRLRVLQWPSENEGTIVVLPRIIGTAFEDLPQGSDVCGENCDALCQVWGGIDLERQAQGEPTAVCNSNLAPVECQCFCKDFTVGDFDGSSSCSEDDLGGGAIAGIVIGVLVFLVCVALLFLHMQNQSSKTVENNAQKEAAPQSRSVAVKDDSQTELNTERQLDEENAIKERTPAQLWDAVLTMPDADVVYTKVTENENGTILVKRKFRLHKPNEKGKVSQRMKLLFPDTATAAHHGFIAAPFKKTNDMTPEPSETTESESEAEDTPIQEIPSLLGTNKDTSPKSGPSQTWSKKKKQSSTSRIVAEIEKRMAADAKNTEKRKSKKASSRKPH